MIWIVEEGGEGTFWVVVEVMEPPSIILIDGTFEDEVLLRIGVL
jgi:hypothetical protein